MLKKYFAYSLLFFVLSCSNIEFVLKDQNQNNNPLRDKTLLLVDKDTEERLKLINREIKFFIRTLDGSQVFSHPQLHNHVYDKISSLFCL